MKPTILTVPPDASLEAIRRQLAQFHNSHVVLDYTQGNGRRYSESEALAQSRLLQRQAQYQRNQLAIITQDTVQKQAAVKTGIPTFATGKDVVNDRWRMKPVNPLVDPRQIDAGLPEAPRWRGTDLVERATVPKAYQRRQRQIAEGERHQQPLPWWLRIGIYTMMGLLIAGLLGGFAVTILPAATVTVRPGQEEIVIAVPMVADPDVDVSDIEAGIVPGRLVELTLENTGVSATTGTQQKPVDRAVGTVVFNNLGNADVTIPRGTVVSTGTGTPVNFRTTEEARLEGGIGARVTVPIEAEEPGISGNVLANTINTVNGAMRFRVRVSNPNGTAGGGSQLVSVVTQEDKDNLLAQVQSEVNAQAYERLVAELEPGEWMPPESVTVYTIAQAFNRFNDDEGDTVELTLRSLVQGTAMEQAAAEEVMLSALRDNVNDNAMLVADSIQYRELSDVSSIGRQIAFTMTGAANYVVPIDPVELKNAITGLSVDEASSLIAQRWQLDSAPEFYQDPEWLPTLPRFANRIQVRIAYGADQELP